jgi:predicted DNA-binding ribbon-helix-helix protein
VVIRGGEAVKSSVPKRSIFFAGYKTSVSLEDEFWNSLKKIASERGKTLGELVRTIDGNRQHANLSSAIRLFVLGFYRDQSAPRQKATDVSQAVHS